MIELVIKKINNYCYWMQDKSGKEYKLDIEFYDLEDLPKINDYVYINKKLINKIDNQLVSFGPIDKIYGKKIKSSDDEDIIVLKIDNKKIYLKRFYG